MAVRPAELHAGTHLVRDLKADDLDRVELVMELEDQFKISSPADEASGPHDQSFHRILRKSGGIDG